MQHVLSQSINSEINEGKILAMKEQIQLKTNKVKKQRMK